jgi:hypothetical protein
MSVYKETKTKPLKLGQTVRFWRSELYVGNKKNTYYEDSFLVHLKKGWRSMKCGLKNNIMLKKLKNWSKYCMEIECVKNWKLKRKIMWLRRQNVVTLIRTLTEYHQKQIKPPTCRCPLIWGSNLAIYLGTTTKYIYQDGKHLKHCHLLLTTLDIWNWSWGSCSHSALSRILHIDWSSTKCKFSRIGQHELPLRKDA